MNFSKAARRGSIGSASIMRPASASVVFSPLPVMHSTVSSSGDAALSDQRLRAGNSDARSGLAKKSPRLRPASPWRKQWSSSEASAAHPPLERITRLAYSPSAGLPMASERAMVDGFCGSISSLPCLTALGNRRAAGGLRAKELHALLGHETQLNQLAERLVNLGDQRARRPWARRRCRAGASQAARQSRSPRSSSLRRSTAAD